MVGFPLDSHGRFFIGQPWYMVNVLLIQSYLMQSEYNCASRYRYIKRYQIILDCILWFQMANLFNTDGRSLKRWFVQVATPICYDQFANAEEIEKLGEF